MIEHVVGFIPGKAPTILYHPDTCLKFNCEVEKAIKSIVDRGIYIFLDGRYEIFPNKHRFGTYALRKLDPKDSNVYS